MSNISLIDGHIDNAEHCVCCGAVIPEGRQVCIICGLKTNYKQSTADVVEVRHGHWGKHYKSGTTVSDGFVPSCCDMWNERETPCCPHCGAKMDGKGGE